ncbi:MAG: NADH-quinone oxidoreductase subunit M [Candidatus Omnitrophica bacterium]|nr:NADH-quinone oxidoreductase subunit M [Candidatus Omnitrophota bacterium]
MGPVSWILLLPFLGAAALLGIPSHQVKWVRRIAAAATGIPLVLALFLAAAYSKAQGGFQWVDRIPWIRALGIHYQVGVDGISAVLVLLHALCSFTGVLISYRIKERVKEYYLFYLLLIGGVYGVFVSLDLFFFYLFYEMAVIPMFPLIGIWGSGEKAYATMKLTLYLTAGAVLALVGLLSLYLISGIRSFDLIELSRYLAQNPIPGSFQRWLFPFLLIGFGVIAPMWPLHSWSPIGHAAAPSAVSMLHAGVLMKLGSYAILRVAVGLLPEGAYTWLPWVAGISIMNILYGGFVALAQKDIKFLIGYSSSSHMGYVLLGIACLNPLAVSGAVLLMFAHGLMTALAFAAVGHIYDQTHTRQIAEWGGLARQVPFIATAFVVSALASSGLPGFANFVAELLVFFGSWETYRLPALAAVFGIVITAFYMLRAVRTGFFGPLNPRWAGLKDAAPFERLPYFILITALVIVGCFPSLLTDLIAVSVPSALSPLEGLQVVAMR